MKWRSLLLLTTALLTTLFSLDAGAADPLDAKYPQLAKLRVHPDTLPSLVKPMTVTLPSPHDRFKQFSITEDKADFAINRILQPAMQLDRIRAFYMGAYEVRSRKGDAFIFGVQAWKYQDVQSAKSDVAKFAWFTADAIVDDYAAADAPMAAKSSRFLRDGTVVVYLNLDPHAPETTRGEFKKLIKSRLSNDISEVPVVLKTMERRRPDSAKPQPFSENSEEAKRELAAIQRKWRSNFSAATSPQKKTALAKTLIREAKKPNVDLIRRYALLLTAAMQAFEAQDVDTVLLIPDIMEQYFDYDKEEGRINLASMACEKRTDELAPPTLKTVLLLCESAIERKNFYPAKVLLLAAQRSPDKRTQAVTKSLNRRILAEQDNVARNNNPGDEMPEPVVVREVEMEERRRPLPPRREIPQNPFVRANGDSIPLPAKFEDVIIGGAGRFLFFQMGVLKKIAVFDVNERKIVRELPLEEADSRIAAGAEHLYIAVRRENVLQRWSLDGFKKELTVKLPFTTPVEEIATGSHATGVIYAGSADRNGVLLNPKTLKPAKLQMMDHTRRKPADPLPGAEKTIVRASPNGRTFCLLSTRHSPGDFRTLVVMGDVVHSFQRGESVSYMAPDTEGELIYTPRGIFTDQTTEFRSSDGVRAERFQMPAVGGAYSVSVDREDRAKTESATVNVHVGSSEEPILSLSNMTVRPGSYSDFHAQNRLTLDRRVFFFDEAELIVTLPTSNDVLVLNRLSIDDELAKSNDDYLHVVSRPPQYVKRNRRFEYQLEVKSSDDAVGFELDSGPSGMRITDEGSVSWRAPRRSDGPVDAVITVSNGSGIETTHAFRLTVID